MLTSTRKPQTIYKQSPKALYQCFGVTYEGLEAKALYFLALADWAEALGNNVAAEFYENKAQDVYNSVDFYHDKMDDWASDGDYH